MNLLSERPVPLRVAYPSLLILVLAISAWTDGAIALFRFAIDAHRHAPVAVWIVAYLALLLPIPLLLLHRSKPVRIATVNLFVLFAAVSLGFRWFNGYGFTTTDARILVGDSEFVTASAWSYLGMFAPVAVFAVLLAATLFFLAQKIARPTVRGAVPIISMAVIVSLTGFLTSTASVSFFPGFFKIPAALLLVSTEGPRRAPQGVALPFARDRDGGAESAIVLIVDESIRGDHLQINGYGRQTTPFLTTLARAGALANYGIASSASNCSASSNLLLRTGVREADFSTRSVTRATSIFEYARAAGYRITLIDGQNLGKTTQNHLSDRERAAIDELVEIRRQNVAPEKIDAAIASTLATVLDRGGRQFVWVNKYGAHFHYETSYPQSARRYRPSLASREPYRAGLELRNSYDNSVQFAVDDFFRALWSSRSVRQATILYTSDHGESLLDDGSSYGHCVGRSPVHSQAKVPLLVYRPGAETSRFLSASSRWRDRMTHFEIFPSILQLMGYDAAAVKQQYPTSLFDGPPSHRRFHSGDVFAEAPFHWNDFPQVSR